MKQLNTKRWFVSKQIPMKQLSIAVIALLFVMGGVSGRIRGPENYQPLPSI